MRVAYSDSLLKNCSGKTEPRVRIPPVPQKRRGIILNMKKDISKLYLSNEVRKYYIYFIVSYVFNIFLNLIIVNFDALSNGKGFGDIYAIRWIMLEIFLIYCMVFYVLFFFIGKRSQIAWGICLILSFFGLFSSQIFSSIVLLTSLLILRKFISTKSSFF